MSNAVLNMATKSTDPNTGLEKTGKLAAEMSKCLADSYLLMAKSQAFHWNGVGPLFHSLHLITEEHYNDLFAAIDDLAERIRALGHPAPTALAEMISLSVIDENEGLPSTETMIKTLVNDHQMVARTFRKTATMADDIGDLVTADMLVARMAFHEKAVWMLTALLAK